MFLIPTIYLVFVDYHFHEFIHCEVNLAFPICVWMVCHVGFEHRVNIGKVCCKQI